MNRIDPRQWLADQLTFMAAERLRRRYPEWADAMLSEQASLSDTSRELGWALGAMRASLFVQPPALLYPALLLVAVLAMVLCQWQVDEGPLTLMAVMALSLCLGLLRPASFLLSGLTIGVVVTGVNGFETFSGVRPAYETHLHTFLHDLHWLILVAPALAASVFGRAIALELYPHPEGL